MQEAGLHAVRQGHFRDRRVTGDEWQWQGVFELRFLYGYRQIDKRLWRTR